MKLIPDLITYTRIVFSAALIFFKPLSIPFYVVYIICGLSDVLDGFIARKTKTVSKFGAKLDSFADMVMMLILVFILYYVINPSEIITAWVILIIIVKFISMAVAFKKYKTFASIHTYANKVSGFALFLFPILLSYVNAAILIDMICILTSLSAVEELAIQVTSKELKLNQKSIFEDANGLHF